jgi:hypothetical protein
MEFTLILLAVAGMWLFWKPPHPPDDHPRDEHQRTEPGTGAQKEKPNEATSERAHCRRWAGLAGLSLLVMLIAALAWWSTEVAYTREVVYFFDSQGTAPQR